MRSWECPKDWKYKPQAKPLSDGALMGIIFAGNDTWRRVRNTWFIRCNASGSWIWPGQTMWVGVVTYQTPMPNNVGWNDGKGSYSLAYLNSSQYLIAKLKGTI